MLGGLVHFTLMHALPLLYFVHRAMLWREVEGKRYWFPVGNVLATLALYFAGILLMVFVISDMGDGWLKTAIDKELDQEWATANPEQAKLLEKSPIGREFLFYIALAIASWIWILMMYAMAVCANTLLISMQKNTRPDLRLEQFRIPPYFLMVLGGCAIVSVVTEGHSGYMSKALLITLMLPYFLSGLRVIHALVRGTQWETAALVTLYVSLPFFIWLVPALVLLGMAYQCNLLAYWPKAIK